jgi:hypothetical protein
MRVRFLLPLAVAAVADRLFVRRTGAELPGLAQ